MVQVIWSSESKQHLNNIVDYISKDNPAAASKVFEGILERTKILELFPMAGSHWIDTEDGEQRSLIFGRYRIGYMVIAEDKVLILGVSDCAQGFNGSM